MGSGQILSLVLFSLSPYVFTQPIVKVLYLQGFHGNVVKFWFLRHHASVAWHDLRGQGRASGGCAWAQNVQLVKLYNLSSSTASWDPSLTSEAMSWHWCMTSQKPTFDDISMEPLHPVCIIIMKDFQVWRYSIKNLIFKILDPDIEYFIKIGKLAWYHYVTLDWIKNGKIMQ